VGVVVFSVQCSKDLMFVLISLGHLQASGIKRTDLNEDEIQLLSLLPKAKDDEEEEEEDYEEEYEVNEEEELHDCKVVEACSTSKPEELPTKTGKTKRARRGSILLSSLGSHLDPIKVEYQDPASGKSYTYNKRTGSTRWTPEAMQKTLSSLPKLEEEELTTGENEMGDDIDSTPEELPNSGKVEYQDPASGQSYLYNTRTGSTRWSTEEVQKKVSSMPKVEEER